jgi:uncharacterized SAM-binding protein YcdF (DUF218 family)
MAATGLIRCRAGDWGTAFLLGFTAFTILSYGGAAMGIPVGRALFSAAALLVFGTGLVAGRRAPKRPRAPEEQWSPLEKMLGVILGLVLLSSMLNAVYFPIDALDAHSYDGRARFMVHDGTLDIALYHWPGNQITGRTNITYPPLYSLGLAVTHAFGGWQSKLLTGLMSMTWPLMLYGFLRQYLARHASLFWSLLLALTPEVYAHGSFGLLNVPAMALILAEAIMAIRFFEDGDRRALLAAGVFAAGAAGVRPDALAPHGALMGCLFVAGWMRGELRADWRRWMPLLVVVGAAPLATWGSWTLYLRFVVGVESLAPMTSEANMGMDLMLRVLPRLLFSFFTYGPVFFVWAVSLGLLWWRRDSLIPGLFLQAVSLLTLAAILVVFSTLDVNYGGGAKEVIDSSLKRSLFYLVPLAGLAAALSTPSLQLAGLGHGVLHARAPRIAAIGPGGRTPPTTASHQAIAPPAATSPNPHSPTTPAPEPGDTP